MKGTAPGSGSLAAAHGFRIALERDLSTLPRETPSGAVLRDKRWQELRYPIGRGGSGSHGEQEYWVYRRRGAATELLFSFFLTYFHDDFSTKVHRIGDAFEPSEEPTLQFGAARCFASLDGGRAFALNHHGLVTVVTRIGRARLIETVRKVADDAVHLMAGIDDDKPNWSFCVGDTNDIGAFLDILFLYSFAVDQAKRHLRGAPLHPRLGQ